MQMQTEQLLEQTLQKMQRKGFDKVQLSLSESEKHELNQQHSEINLLRTGFNSSLSLKGIVNQRKATTSLNQLDEDSIDQAIDELMMMAQSAPVDEANDIAEAQAKESFETGVSQVDSETMYDRLAEFIDYTKSHHPTTLLEEAVLDFTFSDTRLINSNGVAFNTRQGLYNAVAMFTSKSGTDTSSFNYVGFSRKQLNHPLHEEAGLADLLKQSEQQIKTRRIPQKFTGDLLIMPHALGDFTGFLCGQLSDMAMISGTSIYRDQLQQAVASPLLSLHSLPRDELLDGAYPLTNDGFVASDMTLLDQGVLQSNLLSQYGANKTGLNRAANDGDHLVMDAGTTSLEEMIKSIDQGVLLGRFSGGRPNDKGDFSGVAKNSYYIENGEIAYPISETMVSGNMADLFKAIDAVSQERIHFGSSLFPWVKAPGLVFS